MKILFGYIKHIPYCNFVLEIKLHTFFFRKNYLVTYTSELGTLVPSNAFPYTLSNAFPL
jgi:hypothetical protein